MQQRLLDFIAAAPTAYHAVAEVKRRLEEAGYVPLPESGAVPGGKYYMSRGGSSLIALRLPRGKATGFMVTASHSDSPALKLKPALTHRAAPYEQLSCECYGGARLATWMDRPLGIAGRLLVRTEAGIESRLLCPEEPLAIIPTVAPHLKKDEEKLNAAVDMVPLTGLVGSDAALWKRLADCAGVAVEDICGHDLFLVCRERGTVLGAAGELLSAPRLDDLGCAYGCLEGFLRAEESCAVAVYALFDNEEVGSATQQGAASRWLWDVLAAAAEGQGQRMDSLCQQSFLLSADNAHARHPNYPQLSDGDHAPVLNGGVVLKFNANRRYTTDGVSAALLGELCHNHGIALQNYCNRADLPGGSTLGSIATTRFPVLSADIGLPQLSMHSCYETMGAGDMESLCRLARELYSRALQTDGERWQFI